MSKPANKVFGNHTTGPPDVVAPNARGVVTVDEGNAVERMDFPCSVAQERFWLLDRLDPGSSSFNVAVRWRLEGRILTDVLEKSWLKIIERHEVLRTIFLEADGLPIQRVMPQAQFRLHEIDLSNLAPDVQHTESDRIGTIEARAPFDLASGPLVRATLLRFSPTSSIILVTTHQVVSDGWSIGIMASEMGVIYEALLYDKPVPLEPLPIQYADYTLWQLEWLRVRGIEAETAYWTRQLAGTKPFKVLPDHARPGMPTTNGAIVSRVLSRELTNRAQAQSAERGATLFATALAVLCATLARFSNETEIVVGTQVSDRDQVELEAMVGQFVNSLILRNDLGGNPRFTEIVDRVRDTVAQALEHRHIPIERLLGMLKSERSHANSPPISVNFIFQKTFIQNTTFADVALTDMPSLPAGAIYDLNFFMVERFDGWRFSCQYNTDQFEAGTAEHLLSYFESVLESAVVNPARRLSELTLSPPGEARLLLGKLNDTRALYPRDLTLVQLFEARVIRAPDAIAVVCGNRQLTYRELNSAAMRFATYLRKRGVSAGSRIGVNLHASLELPICVLAILKVGATYVPMDVSDPPARRAELIAASKTTALIGQNLLPSAVANAPVDLINIEAALAYGSRDAEVKPIVAVKSEAAACLIFAADAAGAIRTVALSHRSVANLVYSLAKRPGVGDRDVVVSSSPLTLGRAAVEMFLPLLTGARLVIPDARESADGRSLLELLQRTGATVLYGDSELWSDLLRAHWIGVPALKMLYSAQELGARLLEKLSAMGGELWALYGHPEASVWSSIGRFRARHAFAPLGEPIANTALYVLDSSMQIAPVGAIGELFIGGDGLADVSSGRSLVNVLGMELYRTGDLGRLQADGQIEYLGRRDERFTFRGREVVPGEIERILLRHPRVVQAAVVLVEEPGADVFLAAYVAASDALQSAHTPLGAELRQSLAAALPGHLQPAVVWVRASLPQLGVGTVDRRALQSFKGLSDRDQQGTRPSGEIEERLAEIWMSMLGIASVDATDNFFELGGHSLLAARMLAQVERAFGRRIKLATLFVAPTLQEFAKIVAQGDLREFDFRQVVKIQPHGSKQPLIVINNTGIYYGLAKCLGPEQPVYSLQLFDPSVMTSALPQTLEEIAAGYVELIRRVQPQGPYDLMGWCVAGALAFEIARQLTERHERVSHLFLIDSWIPGYLKRLPRLRALIAHYSLRAQLIQADWRRVLSSEKSVWAFVSNRTFVKRIKRLLAPPGAAGETSQEDQSTPETYDQWLLAYLQKVTGSYAPKPYKGRLTLLRSRLEPTGWFFQQDAGWSAFASGVDLHFVDGNHFTMFQEPGASQMAHHVAAALQNKISDQTAQS